MNYLLANPSAGNGFDRAFWHRQLRAAGVEVRNWPDRDTQQPQLGADDRLLVAGGDGTMNAQVNRCVISGCVLGVLPSGTGNDFANGLGIPVDPEQACHIIADGRVIAVDVGYVNDQPFLNVVHVGIGSEVTPRLMTRIKRWWGRFSYVRGAIEGIRSARGFHAKIRCGGERIGGRWLEIAVANGSSFGGGQRIFEASPIDGKLSMVAVRPVPWATLFGLWLRARLAQATPSHEALVIRHARMLEVRSRRPRHITADGETIGHTPGRFVVEPEALRVLVPRHQDTFNAATDTTTAGG